MARTMKIVYSMRVVYPVRNAVKPRLRIERDRLVRRSLVTHRVMHRSDASRVRGPALARG